MCDGCGIPQSGDEMRETRVLCDDCLTIARPWAHGRAALMYEDNARTLVLRLKHADRPDLAVPAGQWIARAVRPVLTPGTLVAPAPLHWLRLLKRRYNQSAMLAHSTAAALGLDCCPDLLERLRRTPTQDGRSRVGRFANQQGSIRLRPRRAGMVAGRPVLLIDDVMTSGATLAAAAEACLAAGSGEVSVAVLARVAKRE
jgi:predicted amidophosphoribosyltransferase